MIDLKKIAFFTTQYRKSIQKKWKSLLLLFLFPIFLLVSTLGIIASLFVPSAKEPISIAFVDEDQTEETKILLEFMTLSIDKKEAIEIISMSKETADHKIENNEISTYILFPKEFTKKLYKGKSVSLTIVGNPSRTVDSFIVKELAESMTRYISSAQANILTVYDYASNAYIPEEELERLIFETFIEFTLYTLGSGQILDEEVITNITTTSPTNYYVVAGWFIAFSIWLFGSYSLLRKETQVALRIRWKLLGVTYWHTNVSQIVVALLVSLLFATVTLIPIVKYFAVEFFILDYFRLFLFILLYGWLILVSLSLVDLWISSKRVGLLLQFFLILILIVSSGAFIPTIYFPLLLKNLLPFFFSFEVFRWIVDIVLVGRNYADFTLLGIQSFVGLILLWISTQWKDRWK
ncbi:ABC transporter permease [Psychrobacillus psychrodurans]|uniref:ABC transporter permease n=1 Tax=Psychrobacillus psychrodurans TaxID=126157 RepID=A0A9X3L693_9BACI|nr:ABC transporter permease [Psychrobacillus psychrodurans]MCZ8531942.1 ABC transporter permease [Psychrobacillus psychrodurans]